MIRMVVLLIAVAVCLAPSAPASAASAHKKQHATTKKKRAINPCRNEGFLPGYRELCEARLHADKWGTSPYWYGGPGFYRGQWNGGGFGPCWTRTPIGSVWNCGR